jgi:SET and MYND domain-containing protein 4
MEAPEKNDKDAAKFRQQGNLEFVKGNYFEALVCYNKSLCFANSPLTASLCYANRSSVYLHLKLYDQCMNNIKLARKYDYPEKQKLDQREEKCLSEHLMAMNKKTSDGNPALVNDFLKLSYPANPKLPLAANCLDLTENVHFGRHVITNRDLKAGDIIAITPNIYNVINNEARFHHCSFCLKSNDLDLITCPDCPRGEKVK